MSSRNFTKHTPSCECLGNYFIIMRMEIRNEMRENFHFFSPIAYCHSANYQFYSVNFDSKLLKENKSKISHQFFLHLINFLLMFIGVKFLVEMRNGKNKLLQIQVNSSSRLSLNANFLGLLIHLFLQVNSGLSYMTTQRPVAAV